MNTSPTVPATKLALVPDVALSGPFSYNTKVAWSPTSDWVALFDPGDWIRIGPEFPSIAILDASTGEQRAVHRGHHRVPNALGWHPLGELIASGGVDQNLHVWHAETGLCREHASVFYGHCNWISSVACDPSGKYVASGDVEGTIHLVDLTSWDVYWTPQLRGHVRVTALAFSPGGHWLLSASQEWHGETKITLWDVAAKEQRRTWRGTQAYVGNIIWSPDLCLFATIEVSVQTFVRMVHIVPIEGGALFPLWKAISAAWMDWGRRIRVVTHEGDIKDYEWVNLINFDTRAGTETSWLIRSGRERRRLVECATSGTKDYQHLFPQKPVPRSRVTAFHSPSASKVAFVEQGGVRLCSIVDVGSRALDKNLA